MKKTLSLFTAGLLALALAVPVAAASDNSRNVIGDSETEVTPIIGSAGEINTYSVVIPPGSDGDGRNGRLTVSTMDGGCCVDFWGVRILKHNGQVMAEAVGNGSSVEFSGAATIPALPRKGVTVEVFYDGGSDVFPANHFIKFEFTGENIDVSLVP